MNNKLICVAGGSGSGKSTLCERLERTYPNDMLLVQLDDYFKPKDQVPTYRGLTNYDTPEALYFDKLIDDIKQLLDNKAVTINTKNLARNPDYTHTDKRAEDQFHPKSIILLEGFLAIQNSELRELSDMNIWLDVDEATRWDRRVHFKYNEYREKVMQDMHQQYAEPSKTFAHHVIDAGKCDADDVFLQVVGLLNLPS